ncbi:acetamidase/formamidase family protein [Fulvivirgaceae bacterium BMA10]|uniref:Acetamidase/formamidase family protein n=1 Tax=Splendidivirga corallicola TaxID=3051826 RepID=A0ABT8KKU0_9BACT|nr:acetamidase/formamidase family protein [Fulvivirgaceae bacterium BMA10]
MKSTTINSKLQYAICILSLGIFGCTEPQTNQSSEEASSDAPIETAIPAITHRLSADQTHNKFSSTIEPVIKVNSGAVVEAYTKEATDGQLNAESGIDDLNKLSFEPIHPLTGPVYVEEAQPGDILAVTLHDIEIGDWGWTAIVPGFGFLADEFTEPYLKTFQINQGDQTVAFSDKIKIPLNPFPGVMGVAPTTDSLLSTIPPRANGGNMDNPYMIAGTTVYFPVFVKGALFSIGDTHAAQGMGEVCGTAIEAPMRIVYEINVIKGDRSITEPEYEDDDYYAVTAFAPTLDEAAKKATRYMVNYLVEVHGMQRNDAYVLCSLTGDLKIAEVVDVPNVLVAMHMPKKVLGI